MEPMNEIVQRFIDRANAAHAEVPGDYVQDGILHCGKCHTPKQGHYNVLGREITMGCLCKCAAEERDREEAARRKQEEADRIMHLRSSGIASQEFRNARFSGDDGQTPGPMKILQRYVENWEQASKDNLGLLLWGGVGTGKSFGAACIANALIERFVPACMVNLSAVLNTLTNFSGDRNEYIGELMQYPLLILDDFGMERKTEFAMEQIFNLIDERYRSGKPLIVTTNLSLEDLKNPASLELARCYDRLLEMCVPVAFGNQGRRQARAEAKMKKAAALLLG